MVRGGESGEWSGRHMNRKDFRHRRFIFDSLKPMAWALLVVSVSWQMADK